MSAVPTAVDVMSRAGTENFTVASRLLPSATRRHFLAVYGFARLADEIGDAAVASPDGPASIRRTLARLDWLEGELDAAYCGRATHPVLVRLTPTLAELALPAEPFRRLIEANRRDQTVTDYATCDELLGYCALSANPVGRLVLAILGRATPDRVAWSDSVCTGLQLVEHLQDVAEDARAGRVYLPAEDRARFRVSPGELTGGRASLGLRALVAFESDRARRLLAPGTNLVASLPPRPRLAVAGFVAGGLAALDRIAAAGGDVLAATALRPPKAAVARRTVRLLLDGERR
jgi:squalene synthase HpnC